MGGEVSRWGLGFGHGTVVRGDGFLSYWAVEDVIYADVCSVWGGLFAGGDAVALALCAGSVWGRAVETSEQLGWWGDFLGGSLWIVAGSGVAAGGMCLFQPQNLAICLVLVGAFVRLSRLVFVRVAS